MKKKLIPDPDRAEKIKEIFEKYVEGISLRTLMHDEEYKHLKEGRKRRCGIDGKQTVQPITYADLRNILRNPIYKGYLICDGVNNEGKELIKAIHVPLVSEELWQKANDKLKERPTYRGGSKTQNKSLLSGLLRCEECQCSMFLKRNGTSKSENRIEYYVCIHKSDDLGCKGLNASVRAQILDKLIFEECKKILSIDKLIDGRKSEEILDVLIHDVAISSECQAICLDKLMMEKYITKNQRTRYEKWGTLPKECVENLQNNKTLPWTVREELMDSPYANKISKPCRKILEDLEITPELFKFCLDYTTEPRNACASLNNMALTLYELPLKKQRDIVHCLIKTIYISKTQTRIVFSTAKLANILQDCVELIPAVHRHREILFERVIPGSLAKSRCEAYQDSQTPKIRLRKKRSRSLKAALEQYLIWEKEIDAGSTIRKIANRYDCSYTMIKSYCQFRYLIKEVKDAILAGELDKQFKVSDITEGKFPKLPHQQIEFFKVIDSSKNQD